MKCNLHVFHFYDVRVRVISDRKSEYSRTPKMWMTSSDSEVGVSVSFNQRLTSISFIPDTSTQNEL